MKLNIARRLILDNLYLYDIKKCHYRILKELGYDVSAIDEDDKVRRNIQIGQLCRKNRGIIQLLRSLTTNIVDEDLRVNGVNDQEIVLRLYDGVLLTRPLKCESSQKISLELVSIFTTLVSGWKKDRYISISTDNTFFIKGVPLRYPEIDALLKEIVLVSGTASKSAMFSKLSDIWDRLHTSKDFRLFRIPVDSSFDSYYIRKYGRVVVPNSFCSMDLKDIDRDWYFNYYLKPFVDSVVSEMI